MGRATDLKAYVKQGAEEAQLEIELKGFRGKKNPVIGMTFTRARDASEWTLQGNAILWKMYEAHQSRSEVPQIKDTRACRQLWRCR